MSRASLRRIDRAEIAAVRRLLERSNDTAYDLARVAEEKCFREGVAGAPAALGAFHGEDLAGVAVACGRHLRLLAVDRPFRKRGIGSALLDAAAALIRDAGWDEIDVAAEAGNYFVPGIDESDCATVAFFEARGYERRGDALNLFATLRELRTPPGAPEIRPATPRDRERVVGFVAAEFGSPWALEVLRAFDAPEPTVVLAETDGVLAGFAAFEANNRGLGTFGPLGVRSAMRGRGTGEALLLAALGALRNHGYRRAIIPWTDAAGFYRRACGATVAHRFLRYGKRL